MLHHWIENDRCLVSLLWPSIASCRASSIITRPIIYKQRLEIVPSIGPLSLNGLRNSVYSGVRVNAAGDRRAEGCACGRVKRARRSFKKVTTIIVVSGGAMQGRCRFSQTVEFFPTPPASASRRNFKCPFDQSPFIQYFIEAPDYRVNFAFSSVRSVHFSRTRLKREDLMKKLYQTGGKCGNRRRASGGRARFFRGTAGETVPGSQ